MNLPGSYKFVNARGFKILKKSKLKEFQADYGKPIYIGKYLFRILEEQTFLC